MVGTSLDLHGEYYLIVCGGTRLDLDDTHDPKSATITYVDKKKDIRSAPKLEQGQRQRDGKQKKKKGK